MDYINKVRFSIFKNINLPNTKRKKERKKIIQLGNFQGKIQSNQSTVSTLIQFINQLQLNFRGKNITFFMSFQFKNSISGSHGLSGQVKFFPSNFEGPHSLPTHHSSNPLATQLSELTFLKYSTILFHTQKYFKTPQN